MAFECQKNTEVSEKSELGLSVVNSSSHQQIEPSQVEPTPDSKTTTGKSKTGSGSNSKDVVAIANPRRSINDLPTAMISEILHFLGPKDLGIVSCVSTSLHRLASEHHVWKDLYCERWVPPADSGPSWKEMFVERDFRSRTFMGRYMVDVLYGHTEPVRAVSLLVSAGLVFTSGYDTVVRMWDLEDGLAIASSPPLGCTVRAIAADPTLLVAGGTEGFVHGWKAVAGLPHLFDIRAVHDESQFRLWEHEGPVTSLALDPARVYSGSWDMTVRVWDRGSLRCVGVLRHGDWVYALAPRGETLAASSGRGFHVWDTASGRQVAAVREAHEGRACSLAVTRAGDFLFTGGADGAIHMFEIRSGRGDPEKAATWAPHAGPVHSLAFEFPWLVSAAGDGRMALIDVRRLVGARRAPREEAAVEAPQRMLHGFGSNLLAVAVGGDRIVCGGGEEGAVRLWNFEMALEKEKRARAMRGVRAENRMRRRRLLAEIVAGKSGTGDHCSVAALKNSVNGDRTGVWHGKRGKGNKLKA